MSAQVNGKTITDEEARKIERARIRRQAKRGGILDGEPVECGLCRFKAHSLVTHIKQAHGLDATGYENELDLPVGSAKLVSDALQVKFKEAGKRGADALAAKREKERLEKLAEEEAAQDPDNAGKPGTTTKAA